MKLYVTGDSHVGALAMGRNRLTPEQLPATVSLAARTLGNGFYLSQPFWDAGSGALRFTRADYAEALRALTGRDSIAPQPDTVFGFCMGFHAARVYRDPLWRQFGPACLPEDERGMPVSAGALDAIFDEDQLHIVGFLAEARRIGVRCIVIASPPPHRGHPCIAEGTSAATVIELDRAYRARAMARLDALRMPYVLPPERAYAPDGFLHPQFRAGMPDDDPHHANPAFGHAMLTRTLRRLGQLGWV